MGRIYYTRRDDAWVVKWYAADGRRTSRTFPSREMAERFASQNLGGFLPTDRREFGARRSRQQILAVIAAHSEEASDGCRIWTGPLMNSGYARLTWVDDDGTKQRGGHRVSYRAAVGPIPAGLVLDHLCRNRACVNPDHLEPVTPRENVMRSPIAVAASNARKTRCPQGHDYSPENTYIQSGGGRICRACQLDRKKVPA